MARRRSKSAPSPAKASKLLRIVEECNGEMNFCAKRFERLNNW